ncbi:MAG: UDP-N-acetylmuramoylalanyl-D-glutamyl-2, 6-diaminopimelate--D-alanyl-D-alanine ligase, partial [Hyphomicrobiaceae bacterium]
MSRHLYDALPAAKRGAWAETSRELAPALLAALRPGDAIMIKGSNGSRMGLLVGAVRDMQSAAQPAT